MSPASAPEEDERSKDRSKARRALDLAGRALDENVGPPDTSIALLLLDEASKACTRAGAEDAELAPIRARLAADDASASALRADEASLAKVLRRLTVAARPPAIRRRRRLTWLAASVLGLGVVIAIPVVRGCSSRGYQFVVSSAAPGYAKVGKLGHTGAYGLLFHTQNEKQPWVEIDLQRERPVSSITVVNRSDCCTDRAVPLSAEIAGEDRNFREVGRQSEDFQTWTLEIPAGSTARWVRLATHKKTMLHLQEIRVR